MRTVSESLAGRAAYLIIRPMTEREKRSDAMPPPWPALLSAAGPDEALASVRPARHLDWRRAAIEGGLPPAALASSDAHRSVWLEGYLDAYLRRDMLDLTRVTDLPAFLRLLRLAALRTGSLLNHANLGRDAALPRTTVQRWLSALEMSYAVTLVSAFARSRTKRLVKSPKLYALDTGLALFLCGIHDARRIDDLPAAGVWLENLVLNDLLAWAGTTVPKASVYHSRTARGEEVDFVVELGERLLPIEIKASSAIRTGDARSVDAFCAERPTAAPFGVVVYDGPDAVRLTRTTVALPLGAVL